nr:hypothetical protein [uncultured Romboutsia sp.]
MVKKSVFGNFIPTITMLVISIISYVFRFKDLIIVGIVGIIPISFFIEGVICCGKRIGWIIPLILSLTIFLIIDKIMLFMDDSLHIYLKYYAVAYILGYILEKIILILKSKIKKM